MFRMVTGFTAMLCAFLLISVGVMPRIPVNAAADFKVYADKVGIRIVSGEPEFGIENMAPGDCASAFLEVENQSSESFALAISAEFMGDDSCRNLFENLIINIEDCYAGSLSGCQGKRIGTFAPGSTEQIPMEISLPTGTGSECQGQAVTVRFRITQLSEPPPSDPDPPDGPNDPEEPEDPEEPSDPDNPGENPEEPIEDPELPVTGTDVNYLLPIGLVMFLIGLLLMCSARKEQKQ